ncbi:MAG: hypothetical protein ACRCYQ_05980 [Nocardioides sp.]
MRSKLDDLLAGLDRRTDAPRVERVSAARRVRQVVQGLRLRDRLLLIGAVVGAALLGVVLVLRTGGDGGSPAGTGPAAENAVPPPVRVAMALAADGRSTDTTARAATVRSTVLPDRAKDFLLLYDGLVGKDAKRWDTLTVEPVAYQVVEDNGEDARILVLSKLTGSVGNKGETTESWEVTGFAVIVKWDRWFVLSYAGTSTEHRPGDEKLEDFIQLETVA